MSDNNCEEVASRARQVAMMRKIEACEQAKGITDCGSVVLVGYDNDFVGVEISLTGNPVEHLPEVLNEIAQSGLIYWHNLSFVTEAFMRTNLENYDVDKYEHGDLEDDYRNNPLSEVVEGVVITTVTWEGEMVTQFTPYKYDDRGRPVFQEVYEPKTREGKEIMTRIGGRGLKIMESFANYCRNELDNDAGRTYVEALGELIEEKGLIEAVKYLSEVRKDGDPELN